MVRLSKACIIIDSVSAGVVRATIVVQFIVGESWWLSMESAEFFQRGFDNSAPIVEGIVMYAPFGSVSFLTSGEGDG